MIALVTGGASSGKSTFAEQLALLLPGPHTYLATMRHGDGETEARIERHRRQRAGKGFSTIELAGSDGGDAAIPSAGTVLLEDLGNAVANGLQHALADVLSCEHAVIVANEVGCDGVCYDDFTSGYIERLGALGCEIAARADLVVEVVAGVPVVVKGALPLGIEGDGGSGHGDGGSAAGDGGRLEPLEFVLIRHGQTPGNGQRRYVGAIDQPLSDEGRKQAEAAGAHGDVARVYVSTLKRTHETAALMFPRAEQVVVEGVQEMDFGAFAGRTADEMADDPDYLAWVDGMCTGRCPGGESQAQLTDRVCAALERLLREAAARGERRVVMVGHGGTMMSFLDRYMPGQRAYWEWLTGNCEGYRMNVGFVRDKIVLHSVRRWPEQ